LHRKNKSLFSGKRGFCGLKIIFYQTKTELLFQKIFPAQQQFKAVFSI